MKLKNQNKASYRVWRIDPAKKLVVPLLLDGGLSNYAKELKRICRAGTLGHNILVKVGNIDLAVAADADAQEGQPGFRLVGSDITTAGISILFGRGLNGGLCAAPVDKAWIERQLIWTSPEETDLGGA